MAIKVDIAGDMVKSTYDPDKDGIIALAQLVAAVCSETEADGKITTHKGDASAHHVKTTLFTALTDRWTLAQAHRGADGKIMVFKGPTADPVEENKPVGTPSSSGSYTGNSTANRAIAHGLGVIPAIVFIVDFNRGYWYRLIRGQAAIAHMRSDSQGNLAVTAPNNTNFFVGNAAEYMKSANNSGDPYYWVAIG